MDSACTRRRRTGARASAFDPRLVARNARYCPRVPSDPPAAARFAHDALFWRKLARLGAQRGPEWWVRYTPPFFGLAAAALVPTARKQVLENLRRIRGGRLPVRDALDTARTFVTYAGCLAEALSTGSKNGRAPAAEFIGHHHFEEARRGTGGVILVTIHSGGWEIVGPLFRQFSGRGIVMVMEAERDDQARRLHDETRHAAGLDIVHVGRDPLASLEILRRLRGGAAVALQLDRAPPGIRAREVSLLGAPARIPEGPLRLAELSGAPIVPVYCARIGYRRYRIEACPLVRVRKRATDAELDDAAQRIADGMTSFLRRHPTQWFHFEAPRGEADPAAPEPLEKVGLDVPARRG